MGEQLWVIEYEGPVLMEDGWTHFRNPPKAREATPADLLAAVGGLATEPDLTAALVKADDLGVRENGHNINAPTLRAILDAALAGRVVVPTEGTPDE